MTPGQRTYARHALGLRLLAKRKLPVPNQYVAGRNTMPESYWLQMVQQGEAELLFRNGSFSTFRLTQAGAAAALLPGERLAPEVVEALPITKLTL